MVHENLQSISQRNERKKALLALEKAKKVKRKVIRYAQGDSRDWREFKNKYFKK